MIKHTSSYCLTSFVYVANYLNSGVPVIHIYFISVLSVHIILGSMGKIMVETQNHFLVCPSRRTPMTAEERLLYLSQPLSSSSVSPSRHLSPDDGQICCFTHSYIKEVIRKHTESKDCVWTLDTTSGFKKKAYLILTTTKPICSLWTFEVVCDHLLVLEKGWIKKAN